MKKTTLLLCALLAGLSLQDSAAKSLADFAGVYNVETGKTLSPKTQKTSIWEEGTIFRIDKSGNITGSGAVDVFEANSSKAKTIKYRLEKGSKILGPIVAFGPYTETYRDTDGKVSMMYVTSGHKASVILKTSHGATLKGLCILQYRIFKSYNNGVLSSQSDSVNANMKLSIFGPGDERGTIDAWRP
jgi:hypothetical protein